MLTSTGTTSKGNLGLPVILTAVRGNQSQVGKEEKGGGEPLHAATVVQ